MKYIIRFIAVIPTLCVGIATIVTSLVAIDYPILVLISLGLGFSFSSGLSHYEETVDDLVHLIYLLCDKTPRYNQ